MPLQLKRLHYLFLHVRFFIKESARQIVQMVPQHDLISLTDSFFLKPYGRSSAFF